ncbi:MAG: hypothetical protein AB1446_10055, partial [Bacillota bacterium]
PWHGGLQERRLPSNHVCCSQSCCLNFLFPLTTRPQLLARVFRHIYPDLSEPLLWLETGDCRTAHLPYVGNHFNCTVGCAH